jgi:hypothetical protein
MGRGGDKHTTKTIQRPSPHKPSKPLGLSLTLSERRGNGELRVLGLFSQT